MREVKSYSEAGGQILFGTDVGFLTDYDAMAQEVSLLAQSGLTFPQILASLTTAPAARFGSKTNSGQLSVGAEADLVVLKGDPAEDIKALTRVQSTIRAGKVIYQAPR